MNALMSPLSGLPEIFSAVCLIWSRLGMTLLVFVDCREAVEASSSLAPGYCQFLLEGELPEMVKVHTEQVCGCLSADVFAC